MAPPIEITAAIGCEHATHEVIKPAATARPGFLATIGVGRDERLQALGGERFDRAVCPIAGVGEHHVEPVGDAGGVQFLSAAVIIGRRLAVSRDSVLISAAITICSPVTTAWAL